MQTTQQLAGEAAAKQAEASARASQEAARLQQTIQQATDRAIREVMSGKGLNADTRDELRDQIRAAIEAARAASYEAQDARAIADAERQAAEHPGLSVGRGQPRDNDIPERLPEVLGIVGFTLAFCVVGFPIARAIGRWIDRRGTTPPAASQDVTNRLRGIEAAVESIAVEVERISEGQRFTARVLTERTHEAAPDFGVAREAVPVGAPANSRRS